LIHIFMCFGSQHLKQQSHHFWTWHKTSAFPIACSPNACSWSLSIVTRFAGFCYGQFMIMRYKFNLVTYVQRPLVVDRRGGTERNLNEIKAGSR
jgi:hypothetical protein